MKNLLSWCMNFKFLSALPLQLALCAQFVTLTSTLTFQLLKVLELEVKLTPFRTFTTTDTSTSPLLSARTSFSAGTLNKTSPISHLLCFHSTF